MSAHIPCGKQSWKTARIVARAASLHCRLVTNILVSSLEIVVQTAGHEVVALGARNDGNKPAWTGAKKARVAIELMRSMVND